MSRGVSNQLPCWRRVSLGPEIALTRRQLAELVLEHYPDEKSEAVEHLDFAIGEFREMKMQPSLERALRHKDIPGGLVGQSNLVASPLPLPS